MNIYDVTDPTRPKILANGVGDFTLGDETAEVARENHSAFAWDAGDKAYAVLVDNEEGTDVDIMDNGVVSIPWGQCIMQAAPGVLTLRVEAADEENLRRIQDLVGGHTERFGKRDQLKVTWQQVEAPTHPPGEAVSAVPAPERGTGKRRWHGRTTVLAAVGALVLAVHLGLGGVLVANWPWTGWAIGGVLAVVLVKVVVLGGFAIHRGRASKGH